MLYDTTKMLKFHSLKNPWAFKKFFQRISRFWTLSNSRSNLQPVSTFMYLPNSFYHLSILPKHRTHRLHRDPSSSDVHTLCASLGLQPVEYHQKK